MPSLVLSLLLATACTTANTGSTAETSTGQSVDTLIGRSGDAGVKQPIDAGAVQTGEATAGQPADAGVARPEPAGPVQRRYVLGSSLNLRKEPSPQGEVLEKLPIGTECATSAPAQSEWLQVECGGKPGYVSASLMGPQKPSAEQHRAEAQDTRRPLAQRLESALRAATLAPEDSALRELLGKLFHERQLELAAADKPSRVKRSFIQSCHQETDTTCLRWAAARRIQSMRQWAETRDGLFVVAIATPERIVVYRGRYQFPQDRKDTGSYPFKGDILSEESFTPTPMMEEAIFGPGKHNRSGDSDPRAIPFGQHILDEASQSLLGSIPREWAWLEPASKPRGFGEGPPFDMLWNCPEKKPFLLTFAGDIHGRWQLFVPEKDDAWIAAVEKTEEGLRLTLDEVALYPKQGVSTRQLLFKLPRGGEDIAYLGEVPFTSKLRRYAQKHRYPCP